MSGQKHPVSGLMEPVPKCQGRRAAILYGVLLALFSIPTTAQTRVLQDVKIKIEAPELDKRLLLADLNTHGKDHGLRFDAAETEYDYRISFGTEQHPYPIGLYGSVNSSMATVDCFDGAGAELFKFNRQGRTTDKGATNAVAKEIIKRLVKLRSDSFK